MNKPRKNLTNVSLMEKSGKKESTASMLKLGVM
jgi:hypothetical protein